MSSISNLRIITELGELIYRQVADLNLSFSRIVDDFTDISNRFGDFSYEFNLPIVKENSLIFGAPESIGSKNFFVKNRNILCQVYNNNQLLLDGLINLESLTKDTYKCKFFSKFKELIDVLNQSSVTNNSKTLKELNFDPILGWDYETSIKEHILANYKNSDETFYQYPISFYSTFYCESSVYSGKTDAFPSYPFVSDRSIQNFYYLFNTVYTGHTTNNRMFFHQIPPAIYMVSIVKQILEDAGWGLGGQFFDDPNIKKIILLYNGTDDIYDQAITGTTIYSGSIPVTLHMEKFLPDMSQADFLKAIINMFNLYFRIDTANKIIEFEPYDVYFRYTENIDPYDLTGKIDISSSNNNVSYFLNNNPSLVFKAAGNQQVFGDNKAMKGSTLNATNTYWNNVSNATYNQTFNRVGYQELSNANLNNYVATAQNIEIPFAEPTIKRQIIWNDYDNTDTNKSAGPQTIYLPMLSKQTPSDNNNMKFNKKDTDTYLFNDESSIKFQGEVTLMYYYGLPTTDTENVSTVGSLSKYMYVNMYIGGVKYDIPIPVVSPFQLTTSRDDIGAWLNSVTDSNIDDRRSTVASYLQALYQLMYNSTGIHTGYTTDFSLVFDDNGYFHETLWTKFHKYKWERYQNSELLTADMIMTSYDWNALQINRPILYNRELYSLVSINGFNPITQRANIQLIKKL
jgi:hypothetical protein